MKIEDETKPTVIHVNTMEIKRNAVRSRKGEPLKPVVLARHKNGRGPASYGDTVLVKHGGVVVAKVVYRPGEKLKSGAVCWVETDFDVEVLDSTAKVSAPRESGPDVAKMIGLLEQVLELLAKKGD